MFCLCLYVHVRCNLTFTLHQHHQRLYVIDSKIRTIDQVNLLRLGHWVRRRYQEAQKKSNEAKGTLADLHITLDSLPALAVEWQEAVADYTAQVPST